MNSPKPRRTPLVSEAVRAFVRQLGRQEMKCLVGYLKAEIATRPKGPRGPRVPSIREQQILAEWSARGLFSRAERDQRAEEHFGFSSRGTTSASALLERQARRYLAAAVKSGRRPRSET